MPFGCYLLYELICIITSQGAWDSIWTHLHLILRPFFATWTINHLLIFSASHRSTVRAMYTVQLPCL